MRFSIYLDYKKTVNNDGKIDVHGFFYCNFLLIFKSVYTAGYSNLCFRLK